MRPTLLPPGVVPGRETLTERISVPVTASQKSRFAALCERLEVQQSEVARSLLGQWMDQADEHLAEQAESGEGAR